MPIGESLRDFYQDRRRSAIGHGRLPNGWSTREPGMPAEALTKIRRRAGKLAWLNLRLGGPDCRPLTHGTPAGLLHPDVFLPAHNLDALHPLSRHFTPRERRRP